MNRFFLLCLFFFTVSFFFLVNNSHAQDCPDASAQIDLDANFVSARLLTGGGLWWDLAEGKYIVPSGGQTAALFTGCLWMGGLDDGGVLHLAGQTYGAASAAIDYWPGPLADDGTTTANSCTNWDKFFVVTRPDIEAHQADWADNFMIDGPIPSAVRGWPGVGNPFFMDEHGFELPTTSAGLAPFYDWNEDGIYNPEDGDYPLAKGDQSIWWVFNDEGAGAIHGQTNALPLGMEVQVNAFSFDTDDDVVSTTTFYDYRLIYRGAEPLNEFYLSLWVDPDLGCWSDDYIGCNPEEELGFIYNADDVDENCSGLIGYGTDIPVLGIKVLNSYAPGASVSTGMSKFMFFNNAGSGSPPPGTTDPLNGDQFYGYMKGAWLDGSKLTEGGDGYDPLGTPTDFAYDGNPSDADGWSECSAAIPPGDRRFLMSFGPYTLQPGDIGEFSFAAVWIPSQVHPCPDMTDLVDAANDMKTLYEEHGEEIMITSTSDLVHESMVQFSPNPASSIATLHVTVPNTEINTVQLFSASGNMVKNRRNISGPQTILEMSDLSNGLYLYRAMLNNGQVATGKFILEK